MNLQDSSVRKNKLIERIAAQRVELSSVVQNLERPLGMLDKGLTFAQKLKHQPKLLLGLALLIAVILRKRFPALVKRAPILAIAQWWFLKK
jgi:hypothetical protein